MLVRTLSRMVAALPSGFKYRVAALKPWYTGVLRRLQATVPVELQPGRIIWQIDRHTSQEHLLGTYEPYMQRALDRLLRPGQVFYDIGAHTGFHSLYGGLIVGSGRVFAFEPNPGNIVSLQRQLACNPHLPITLCPYALSDRSGVAGLAHGADSSQSYLSSTGSIQVNRFRIDDLVAQGQIAPPNLLKIDVEGHEAAVLQGATETIARCKPIIICDFNDATTPTVVHAALGAHGYRISSEQVVIALPDDPR